MFSGIIRSVGRIVSAEPAGGDIRVVIDPGGLDPAEIGIGDSIAVSGVCLTVAGKRDPGLVFDVSRETLACTALGGLDAGDRVNLEPALRLADRLDGHLVSGHVDGVGSVTDRRDDARSVRLCIEAPAALGRFIAVKGSIAVDGVSLTVNGIEGDEFDVNVVPHTLEHTVIDEYRPGRPVNLEVDLVARYLARLLDAASPAGRQT